MIHLTPSIALPFTEHVYIVGLTGSGKTTLVKTLYTQLDYAIVIDTKEDIKWTGFRVTKDPMQPFNVPGKWVFRPPVWWQGPQWRAWFALLMKAGGYVVYVDETHDLTLGKQDIINAFAVLLTKGRGKGITVWAGSQRPRWLPKFLITETRHKFLFYVQDEDDRDYMARTMVKKRSSPIYARMMGWEGIPEYGFFYANPSKGIVKEFSPVRA